MHHILYLAVYENIVAQHTGKFAHLRQDYFIPVCLVYLSWAHFAVLTRTDPAVQTLCLQKMAVYIAVVMLHGVPVFRYQCPPLSMTNGQCGQYGYRY